MWRPLCSPVGAKPSWLRALSLFHLWLPPLWVWMIARLGDPRTLRVQTALGRQQLLEVRAYDADIATAVLTRDRLARPVAYVRELIDADGLHPGCAGDADSLGLDSVSGAIDCAMIEECRDAGLLVNAWTENDPDRMRALIAAGVTGIVTDYPSRLARVLQTVGQH